MNILITGGDGFIAKNIYHRLKNIENVYCLNHQTLDIQNLETLKNFIKDNHIDIVIHTASVGGRYLYKDSTDILYQNLIMAENIILASRNCKLVIFFGSGAEFDRETNIENATEDDIQSCIPKDFYGLSKNLISKRILSIPNIIILRIFNCFGYGEVPNRFITSAIKNNPLIIHQNKYMDFFYIEDLYNIILYYIQNFPNVPYKDLNCVYQLKYTLIDIAHLVKNLNIKIEQEKLALSYTGNGYKLTKLPIKLKGLTQSLEEFHRLII